jgi:predicted Zn-dependent protease
MHGMCNYATLTTDVDLPNNWIGLTTYGACAADVVNVETMTTRGVNPAYYTPREVKQVTMHELGHVAGLDHEPEDPNSIMFPNIGDAPLALTQKSICLVQNAFFRSKGFR